MPSNAKLNHNPIDFELRDANSIAAPRSLRSIERIPRAQRRKERTSALAGKGGNFCKLSALGARLDERARDQPRKFSAWRDGRLSLKLETGRNYIARQKHGASRARYGPRTDGWDAEGEGRAEGLGEERGPEARGKNAFFFFIQLLTMLLFPATSSCLPRSDDLLEIFSVRIFA